MLKEFNRFNAVTLVAIIVLLNLFTKYYFLGYNSLNEDEAFSLYHSRLNLKTIIELLWQGNNPPLYEIFLHFWGNFFGISEISLRLPSLIFSTITVYFIYKYCDRFFNQRIAIYSSLIYVFSNYHIVYAHEARVYALLGMLTIISFYNFTSVIQTNKNVNYKIFKNVNLIFLTIVNVLMIYAHYFGFFVLAIQFLYLISTKKLIKNFWRELLLSTIVITLIYLPNIIILFERFLESSTKGTWVKPPNGVDSLYNMIRQFSNEPVIAVFSIILLSTSIFKMLSKKNTELKSSNVFLVNFWFFFIFLTMFIVSYKVPMFIERYLMSASIAFIICLGISLDTITNNRKINNVFAIIFCILFIVTANFKLPERLDIKKTIDFTNNIKKNESIIIFCPKHYYLNFSYYYFNKTINKLSKEDIQLNLFKKLQSDNIHAINSIEEIDLSNTKHIIYLDFNSSFSNPKDDIKNLLTKGYFEKSKYKSKGMFEITEFELKQN
jgi:mannosyltransferase